DVQTLIKNADAAMYRAKERGKNRYCFYTMDLTRSALERLQLENDLRLAIKRDEFQVYYQPQYSLSNRQLVGAEALLRWKHSELGYVSPIKFIPLAESVGLILSIGEYVLRESCIQMKRWLEAGHALERIGVNVSGQQIQRGDFVQTVRNILEETGLEPQYLELEITESFIMEQANEAITALEELRSLGVTLAIDDFGTGYSSLSYLKRLPIDKLKIDRSFINDIPDDSNDMAIAKAIIALGKTLQLKVIAEGVETEEQEAFVCFEGCDEVQGFYYSRPVPEAEFVGFLENEKNGDIAALQEGVSK
ncbi:MAG: GGDEF domain-containing phosphodiesterase, partial [Sedimenticola sp.]